ncbi:DUF455 family protein [Candidatus Protochlamydia phocaeensis]|uniref:DUF455 family protein n=1 Tax=Candidatus Protochlamydia phocaeensis TaxID=1414722 RepID=UPI0009AE9FF0|nr:DUF455 family protein [Candidatus Protochlamydia phocaeensis]
MELREWAQSILAADTLAGKLACPAVLTDDEPGPALIWEEPVRPPGMAFTRRTREEKLPPFQEHGDPDKRAICLHRFAGHELLAVEIMAFTLLAFPDAPKRFRKGLANTLKEEQGHVRLYMERMSQLGIQFGDLPLYRHFWKHTPHIHSPLHYISMMSLTFEMANLDFAPMYGKSFLHFGDQNSAELMATILKDEIAHVSFGWHWLRKLKEKEASEWDSWEKTLASTLLTPKRAKGFCLHEEPRYQAGIPSDWIEKLKSYK